MASLTSTSLTSSTSSTSLAVMLDCYLSRSATYMHAVHRVSLLAATPGCTICTGGYRPPPVNKARVVNNPRLIFGAKIGPKNFITFGVPEIDRFRENLGSDLVSIWDRSGVGLGSFWGRSGDRFGAIFL